MSARRLLFFAAHGSLTLVTSLLFILVIVPCSRIERLLRPKRRPRILYGPTPFMHIARNAQADRQRGLQADTLVYEPFYVGNPFTYVVHLKRRPSWQRLLVPYAIFLWAAWRYDVFQFHFDRGLLIGPDTFTYNPVELPLLKLAGKGTVASAYGSDVRFRSRCVEDQPYNLCMGCPGPNYGCVCDADKATRNIAHVVRWAGMALSTGDTSDYTPGTRRDIFYLGLDLDRLSYVGARHDNEGPVRIAHAPTDRNFKGTHYLIDAVARLQAAGLPVELDLIERVSNDETLERCKQADIIADQFIMGHHGVFTLEAMALGKPVLCFIRHADYLPTGVDCPIVSTTPDDLEDTIKRLATSAELRQDLGRRGRQFVETVYAQPRVAERMARVYEAVWGCG
jgi:glycosyltransferase involved in cell wall biosynthesis